MWARRSTTLASSSRLWRPTGFVSRTFCTHEEQTPILHGVSPSPFHDKQGPEPVKESTHLAGVEVVPNGREVLMLLYKQTLDEFKTLPEDYEYRTIMERATRDRLKVLEENERITEIERIIDSGQIEELINHARCELDAIAHIREAEIWKHKSKNEKVVILAIP